MQKVNTNSVLKFVHEIRPYIDGRIHAGIHARRLHFYRKDMGKSIIDIT